MCIKTSLIGQSSRASSDLLVCYIAMQIKLQLQLTKKNENRMRVNPSGKRMFKQLCAPLKNGLFNPNAVISKSQIDPRRTSIFINM
jgi:hypothetical protein